MRGVRLLLCGALLMGCGARSGLDVPKHYDASVLDGPHVHDAGLDAEAGDAGVIPLQTVCPVPDAGRPATVCTVSVAVSDILSETGCINDYAIQTGETGQIEYACDGTSTWAQATFSTLTLQGSIHGTFVDVCFGTQYHWQDGANCEWSKSIWSTSQRIYGDITSSTLTYTYGEKIIEGHSCWWPCTAHADIAIQ